MRKISVLDCTLRDGGYVNDWCFGRDTMQGIGEEIVGTGVDIFEICFMRDEEFHDTRGVFPTVRDIRSVIPKKDGIKYAAMIETGCLLPIEMLEDRQADSIDIIRFIMWKDKMDLAYEYCKKVKEKGYEVFIQPTRVDQYSLDEFKDMILKFNTLDPDGLYIVDTFGCLDKGELLEYVKVADTYLKPDVMLGYHAHNNLLQAQENASAFLEYPTERDIILDASISGIGRGAGNLPLELLAKTLNEHYGKSFDLMKILAMADRYIEPIKENYSWGYNSWFYITALLRCNPNYAIFFAEKESFSIEDFYELLNRLTERDKIRFTKENAEKFYLEYQNKISK